jgi:uncharacterized membrane protein
MASRIVVLAFEGAGAAEGMLVNVRDMEKRGLLKLDDAVVASRGPRATDIQINQASMIGVPAAGSQLQIDQTDSRRGRSAAAGGGIGLLAGMLIGGPIGGLAVGALIGALRDRGLKDKEVQEIADRLVPDSSALFLLVKEADGPKVLEELKPFKATVIQSTLEPEAEERLRAALAREELSPKE